MRRESIQIVTRGKFDRDGNPIGAVTAPITVPGCVIWPRASEEKDGGEVNIDGQNVKLPDNAITQALRSDDHVLIRGETHAVDEPPARYIGKAVMIKTKRVTT